MHKIAQHYKLPYYTISPTYSICRNHGYIAGEVYECPDCHEETEVYSRITGYYRPVKNWNDGKAQEFKDRKLYDLGYAGFSDSAGCRKEDAASTASSGEGDAGAVPVRSSAVKAACAGGLAPGVYVVATQTCPNCKRAEKLLDDAGISYRMLSAEDDLDLIREFDIMQAPSLVEVSSDGSVDIARGPHAVFGRIPCLVETA